MWYVGVIPGGNSVLVYVVVLSVMHDSGYILIPVPIPIPGKTKSPIPVLIPIPAKNSVIPF